VEGANGCKIAESYSTFYLSLCTQLKTRAELRIGRGWSNGEQSPYLQSKAWR